MAQVPAQNIAYLTTPHQYPSELPVTGHYGFGRMFLLPSCLPLAGRYASRLGVINASPAKLEAKNVAG